MFRSSLFHSLVALPAVLECAGQSDSPRVEPTVVTVTGEVMPLPALHGRDALLAADPREPLANHIDLGYDCGIMPCVLPLALVGTDGLDPRHISMRTAFVAGPLGRAKYVVTRSADAIRHHTNSGAVSTAPPADRRHILS